MTAPATRWCALDPVTGEQVGEWVEFGPTMMVLQPTGDAAVFSETFDTVERAGGWSFSFTLDHGSHLAHVLLGHCSCRPWKAAHARRYQRRRRRG